MTTALTLPRCRQEWAQRKTVDERRRSTYAASLAYVRRAGVGSVPGEDDAAAIPLVEIDPFDRPDVPDLGLDKHRHPSAIDAQQNAYLLQAPTHSKKRGLSRKYVLTGPGEQNRLVFW